MNIILIAIIIFLSAAGIILQFIQGRKGAGNLPEKISALEKEISRIENAVREEIKSNRQETGQTLNGFQSSFLEALNGISRNQLEQLKSITDTNQQVLSGFNKTIEDKMNLLVTKTEENNKANREELARNLKEFSEAVALQLERINGKVEEKLRELYEQAKSDGRLMRESIEKAFRDFQGTFDRNVESFNNTQKEKFGQLEIKQNELIANTEKKLEQMRETVDEKLQKTLNERLGQSFETVSRHLLAVQEGLGEMKNLAQDVGGLKKVLSNVKMRGGIGEVQLSMLLEQILAPEQYEANVRTKKGSADCVEFAIKLPGKDDMNGVVYLPIDAKFPKESYEQLVDAYETADTALIDTAAKNIENVIRKMAKDIHDKYIDPPGTTDFGIMFLPFEGIYAEVVRRASLLEQLQRDFKIVVTGPTTLAAILNSLQMGFKTLAIQKRSGEVWSILKAIKTEFGEFGKVLTKAQEKIVSANDEIDKLVGVRTRQINRKLKEVEILNPEEARRIITESAGALVSDGETPED
jgi:DNA recombination protein RmuC